MECVIGNEPEKETENWKLETGNYFPYPPAFNSVRTCLAISFRVSKTPTP
jgi:hypothetical protein